MKFQHQGGTGLNHITFSIFSDVPLLLLFNKAFYNSKMNCLCSSCYIVMFILCIIVSSSHFALNIFIYGPPVAITDIVNCLQHFCKYIIRILQCYFTLYVHVLLYNTWSHHVMTLIVYLCLKMIMTLVNYLMTPIHRC